MTERASSPAHLQGKNDGSCERKAVVQPPLAGHVAADLFSTINAPPPAAAACCCTMLLSPCHCFCNCPVSPGQAHSCCHS
jgi:hypothetical protein